MILDIPVQLTVELGRTRIPIKHILQLAQGSVVELEALAGEPMDVLVNGYLIAQGEVVVVNDKFGIRLTDIVTPSERMRRPQPAPDEPWHMTNGLTFAAVAGVILALIPAALWLLKRTPLGGAGSGPAGTPCARWRCCRCPTGPARGDGGSGPGRRAPVAGAGRLAAGHQHAAHHGAAGRGLSAAAPPRRPRRFARCCSACAGPGR
jgi:flagellar motor switch protein FliN